MSSQVASNFPPASQPELRFTPTLHRLLSCFLRQLSILLASKKTVVLECPTKACILTKLAFYRHAHKYAELEPCTDKGNLANILVSLCTVCTCTCFGYRHHTSRCPEWLRFQSQGATSWPATKLGPRRLPMLSGSMQRCFCVPHVIECFSV